jgi:hypothetical protein
MPAEIALRMTSSRFALPTALLLAACSGEELAPREVDGPEPVGVAAQAETVGEAVGAGCSTTSVKGLAAQIVAQANCIEPGAFVLVPDRPNVTFGAAVFPYLELPARDAFVTAVDAHAGMSMTVNSMLRTVAQQYLLYAWYLAGSCGIALAAKPGGSNHESGLALDISEYGAWQAALEAEGFAWFGDADPVHYDYEGPGAVDYRGTDVLAFQQLWNDNHPEDLIDEDGIYGPQTEARLVQSPADGFPIAPSCEAPGGTPVVAIAVDAGAEDVFADHGSLGVADAFEGERVTVTITLANQGDAAATNVDFGLAISAPWLVASDYLIESDWTHPGTFAESDANASAENPPHGQDLADGAVLRLNALSPGETKRLTLTVRAAEYSIDGEAQPSIGGWVADIPGVHHQDGPGAAPTLGSAPLEGATRVDVYSHERWEWASDRQEGWQAFGGLSLEVGDGALVATAPAGPSGAGAQEVWFAADEREGVELVVRRSGGSGAGRLLFATEAEPAIDDAHALPLDVPDDGAFHTITVRGADHPAWTGHVTGLRVEPFAAGPGEWALDSVHAVVIAPHVPTSGSGMAVTEDDAGSGGACSCELAGSDRGRGAERALALLAATALLGGARRRRVPRVTAARWGGARGTGSAPSTSPLR